MSTWQAPSTSRPVHATVMVPGSKSLTNRALVLATLATRDGTSTISGALRSRDTDLMSVPCRPSASPSTAWTRS